MQVFLEHPVYSETRSRNCVFVIIYNMICGLLEMWPSSPRIVPARLFLDPEGSLSDRTVFLVLVVVTRFRKMPKALLTGNGKLRLTTKACSSITTFESQC